MLEKTFARFVALSAITLTPLLAYPQTPPASPHHTCGSAVSAVSPTLYGLMTEEINFSYDGGLYAEMVRNRTFQSDWTGIPYWYLLEGGSSVAKMAVDDQTGPSEALKSSLKLEVEQADPKNQAGVLNVGYWGIPLRPATTYKGSFYAKADSADLGPITVSVVSDETGKTLATATVPAFPLRGSSTPSPSRPARCKLRPPIISFSRSAMRELSGSISSRSSRPRITTA